MIVESCGWKSVAPLLLPYHYLNTQPAGIVQCYVLLDDNGLVPLGAAVFTTGKIQYSGRFLEFARLWLDDRCPKNSESWFVSRCLRDLQKNHPDLEGVITWADPQMGHDGTVYLATNFVYDGESRKVAKFYNPMTKKIISYRGIKKQTALQRIKKDDPPKRRFIYYFDPVIREKLKGDKNGS